MKKRGQGDRRGKKRRGFVCWRMELGRGEDVKGLLKGLDEQRRRRVDIRVIQMRDEDG